MTQQPTMNEAQRERYSRQILFSGIGEEGQEALLSSSTVVVGVGALGSHAAELLVRSGLGRVRLIDPDEVELSNLQRQALFDEDDVRENRKKAVAAARKLRSINSTVEVEPIVARMEPSNAVALLEGFDLVLDCTDNFEARYILNDACFKLGIPWVYTGVAGAYGMSATFVPGRTPCLQCVLGREPPKGKALTAETSGIIAPIVRFMSAFAVAEGLKILTGKGKLNDGLLYVDLWNDSWEKLSFPQKDPDCPVCKGIYRFLEGEN